MKLDREKIDKILANCDKERTLVNKELDLVEKYKEEIKEECSCLTSKLLFSVIGFALAYIILHWS